MTSQSEANGAPHELSDEERAPENDALLADLERRLTMDWVGDHLPQVRRSAYGQRSLYWSLGIGFAVGLAAHVGGFLLKTSATTEPLELVADLLYAFGWALWTGVVVVLFLQVLPEAKRRGYKQLLDAYEANRGKVRGEREQ